MSEVRAPIAGSVCEVLVGEGDPVQAAQTVVVLESMKLEIPVDSERAGTVRRVAVAVGQVVAEGDVLVVLL